MTPSCVNCRHRLGVGPPEDRHWFCRWLESVLPPPIVEAMETEWPALQTEIPAEDLEDNGELCPCYELDEPTKALKAVANGATWAQALDIPPGAEQ